MVLKTMNEISDELSNAIFEVDSNGVKSIIIMIRHDEEKVQQWVIKGTMILHREFIV